MGATMTKYIPYENISWSKNDISWRKLKPKPKISYWTRLIEKFRKYNGDIYSLGDIMEIYIV